MTASPTAGRGALRAYRRSLTRFAAGAALWSLVPFALAEERERTENLPEFAEEQQEPDGPTMAELEAAGAVIRSVRYDIRDIFDTSEEDESGWFYRMTNRLHANSRESTIKSRVLFRAGEEVSEHKIKETERLLRRYSFLSEADVHASHYADGEVDLTVTTHDNWTLFPELSFSRSGGENESIIGVEDENVLGTGSRVSITRERDFNRTSTVFEFSDSNLGRSWVGLDLGYSDADDGSRRSVRLQRPFYSLDARWAAGTSVFTNDREDPLFSDGEEVARYRNDQRFFSASAGRSKGLVDGWVRRWSVGLTMDENVFSSGLEPGVVDVVPEDRDLVYPFIDVQVIEDRFVTAKNLNLIAITEDVFLGTAYGARLGWSDDAFGADRDALIFSGSYARSVGSPEDNLLLLRTAVDGRLESGDPQNTAISGRAQFYRRQSERRTFFASLNVVAGFDLDLDNPVVLDGDTGLRGYPFRYRNGDSSAVLSFEQRYYTDWYPLRLFRVGGAVFFDAGRIWGADAVGREDDEILTDVGFGLRLGSTRVGSNKVVHVDIAFPLNGDDSIDSVQLSIDAKRTF